MVQAAQALDAIGLPAIIRPSFTLGGTGGGIAYNRQEFFEIVQQGLDASPTTEVLIDESVLGWKEYEMEVVRDRADNCINRKSTRLNSSHVRISYAVFCLKKK